jgi:hypothetical protein
VLGDGARFLWEAQHRLQARQRKSWGATRPNRKGDARETWVTAMARAWREKHPGRPSSGGIRWLHKQAEKQNFRPWPTQEALRLWMHRKRIQI